MKSTKLTEYGTPLDEAECPHCRSVKDESPDARLYDVIQNLLSDAYLSKK